MSAARPLAAAPLLGALLDADGSLLKSSARDLIELAGLVPDDFAEDPTSRAVFCAIQRLAEHGRPIDATTVFFEAKRSGPVDAAALQALTALQASNSLDRAKFEQVADAHRQEARARAIAGQLKRIAFELERKQRSASTLTGELEALAAQLGSEYEPDHTGDEDLLELLSEWSRAGEAGLRPVLLPSCIAQIDEHLGGWAPALNMIIGQPSAGKSALAATAIDLQLRAGRRPGLFGLEDGTRWFPKRLLARELDVPVRDVASKPVSPVTGLRMTEVGDQLTQRLANLRTFRRRGIGITDLLRRAQKWITLHGVDSIWIDNLKMVWPRQRWGKDPRAGVSESIDLLARLADKYRVPVILLAHTKRPPNDSQWASSPPAMHDIAETADAERFAFNILGLWRKSAKAQRCTILKAKEGPPPGTVTVELDWLGESALVSDDARPVNLAQERRQEREARAAEREEAAKRRREQLYTEAKERREKAAAEKAAAKAAGAVPPKPVQQPLLPEGA